MWNTNKAPTNQVIPVDVPVQGLLSASPTQRCRCPVGVILGLYWGDMGIMENGNHHDGLYRCWGLGFKVCECSYESLGDGGCCPPGKGPKSKKLNPKPFYKP